MMMTTTCARASCQAPLRPIGDGSVTKRCHPQHGGVYFCNETCATAWERAELISGQVVGLPSGQPRRFTSVAELRTIEAERFQPQ